VARVERRLALLSASLVAVGALVAAPGSVSIERTAREDGWSQICSAEPARPDRVLLAACARVHGRVVWVRHRPGEVHLAVLARLHLFIVKLAPQMPAPSLGASLTAVGPLVRARNGMREVQAFDVSL
jgi:hypothetical protein